MNDDLGLYAELDMLGFTEFVGRVLTSICVGYIKGYRLTGLLTEIGLTQC